jgi:hypothetical protein
MAKAVAKALAESLRFVYDDEAELDILYYAGYAA